MSHNVEHKCESCGSFHTYEYKDTNDPDFHGRIPLRKICQSCGHDQFLRWTDVKAEVK